MRSPQSHSPGSTVRPRASTTVIPDGRGAVGSSRSEIRPCVYCGGAVRAIACIEDPVVIERNLTHVERREAAGASPQTPRAPPASSGDDSP